MPRYIDILFKIPSKITKMQTIFDTNTTVMMNIYSLSVSALILMLTDGISSWVEKNPIFKDGYLRGPASRRSVVWIWKALKSQNSIKNLVILIHFSLLQCHKSYRILYSVIVEIGNWPRQNVKAAVDLSHYNNYKCDELLEDHQWTTVVDGPRSPCFIINST